MVRSNWFANAAKKELKIGQKGVKNTKSHILKPNLISKYIKFIACKCKLLLLKGII